MVLLDCLPQCQGDVTEACLHRSKCLCRTTLGFLFQRAVNPDHPQHDQFSQLSCTQPQLTTAEINVHQSCIIPLAPTMRINTEVRQTFLYQSQKGPHSFTFIWGHESERSRLARDDLSWKWRIISTCQKKLKLYFFLLFFFLYKKTCIVLRTKQGGGKSEYCSSSHPDGCYMLV